MSNNPPKDADYYLGQLKVLEGPVAQWCQGVVNDHNAGELSDLVAKIKSLSKDAEKDRKAIKEPYLAQGRKIDADFKPVTETAKSLTAPLQKMLTAYLAEQEEAKRRAAEEARRIAEAEAAEAEKAKDDAFIGDVVAESAKQSELEAKRAEKEAKTTNVKGFEVDRAIGLRTYRKASIKDAGALVAHYADHPDVIAVCEKLANARIRAAKGEPVSIPGVDVIEERKVA